MKRGLFLFCALFALTGRLYSQETDSSDLIFNDQIVHNFELQFYIEAWSDTLEYNKEKADEAYMPAKMIYHLADGDSIVLDSIGVRYKGNSSYELAKNTPKKSFKFNFNEYKDQTFFECERLNFNNCVLDPSYIREKISYDLARQYMVSPRVAYATIKVNGTLIGVYTQVEQVDELFLKRNFAKSGGNLYKAGDNGAYLEYNGPNQSTYEQSYELKTNGSANDWSRFVNMVYKLNETSAAEFVQTMLPVLDLDVAIRNLAWCILLSNFDSYTGSGRNYYFYDDPKSGQFIMIPWDLNLSFGQYANNWDVIKNNMVAIGNLDKRPLNRRILENDSLKNVYFSYIRDMIAGKGSLEAISAEADRLKALINDAVKSEPEDHVFYAYDDFVKSVDSNLVIKEGLKSTTIWGIKSFTAARNAELAAQIEAGVTYRPVIRRTSGAYLQSRFNLQTSTVTIEFNAAGTNSPARLVVLDSHGRTVHRMSTNSTNGRGTVAWRTGTAAPGIYVIMVSNGNATLTDRVIITK